jgi:hypothetical protein
LALGLTVAGASPLRAQDCQPVMHPVGAPPIGTPVVEATNLPGGSEGRISVVVQSTLYEDVSASIEAFAAVLQDEGHSVTILQFFGPPDALRTWLHDQWDPQGQYADDPITGTLLVGDIPYILASYTTECCGSGNAPTDMYYADLTGTWEFSPEGVATGWFDNEGAAEIWVSRVKVDNLVNLKADTELSDADLINAFFARDLDPERGLRQGALSPGNTTLAYSMESPLPSDITRSLGAAFDLGYAGSESVCGAAESWDDYLEQIGGTGEGGGPGPYYWIDELNHGLAVSHGAGSGRPLAALPLDAGAHDFVGWAVAVSGNTAVVGATGAASGTGVAYVLVEDGGWTVQDELEGAGGLFGANVAIDGDTLAVGAPAHSDPGAPQAGAVYVFTRSAGAWTLQGDVLTGGAAYDAFGSGVALTGDTLLVGASRGGYATVFVREDGVWTAKAELTPDPATPGDGFGASVSLSGDTALVGAPGAEVSGVVCGAAYAFTRSGGVWSQQAKLNASEYVSAGDSLGSSVAINGDTALIGAPDTDLEGTPNAGAAYLYVRCGPVWGDPSRLTPWVPAQARNFGSAVALDDEAAAIGGPGSQSGRGAVYTYYRLGDMWLAPEDRQVYVPEEILPVGFGASVAVQHSLILAGAPGTASGAGSAYDVRTARGIYARDYLDRDTRALGVTIDSCSTCDYAFSPPESVLYDPLGQAVAFNPSPDTNVLLVAGYTSPVYASALPGLWKTVGAGGSFGDGLRTQISLGHSASGGLHEMGFLVVFGDPTLRPPAIDWTGDGLPGSWSDRDNWDASVPNQYDHVRINGAEVEMDMDSSPDNPHQIWSLNFTGDDCSLHIPGETPTEAARALQAHGSVIAEASTPPADIHIGSRAKLDVDRADLRNFSVTVEEAPVASVGLNVGGSVESCTIDAGEQVGATLGPVRKSHVTLHGSNSFNAGNATGCAFTIGSGADVTLGEITGCPGGGQNWSMTGASVTGGNAELWGNWSFSSGTATFARMTARSPDGTSGISLSLTDSAQLTISTLPALWSPWDLFPDDIHNHALVYGAGDNVLTAGDEPGGQAQHAESFHFGGGTCIARAEGTSGTLTLDLKAELNIQSCWDDPFVRDHWDSTGVNIVLEPIADEDLAESLELISPDLSAWYTPERAVVFSDCECQGAFNDLDLRPVGEGGAVPVNVWNGWRNAPGSYSMFESGFFHNVTIDTGREINFWSDNGKIYYWGSAPVIHGSVYLDRGSHIYNEPLLQSEYWRVFVPATLTRFGDWNGDGQITGLELKALQNAIAGGAQTYNGLMDGDCSGALDNADLNKFLANYGNNLNGGFVMGAGSPLDGLEEAAAEEMRADDGEEPPDYAELAGFLIDRLCAEDLGAFIDEASLTAEEHADDGVAVDLTELLAHLP